MRTIYEIVEELICMLESLSHVGCLVVEEEEQLDSLINDYRVWESMAKEGE